MSKVAAAPQGAGQVARPGRARLRPGWRGGCAGQRSAPRQERSNRTLEGLPRTDRPVPENTGGVRPPQTHDRLLVPAAGAATAWILSDQGPRAAAVALIAFSGATLLL